MSAISGTVIWAHYHMGVSKSQGPLSIMYRYVIHIYLYTYICIIIHTYIHTYVYVKKHIHTHIYIYTHAYTRPQKPGQLLRQAARILRQLVHLALQPGSMLGAAISGFCISQGSKWLKEDLVYTQRLECSSFWAVYV